MNVNRAFYPDSYVISRVSQFNVNNAIDRWDFSDPSDELVVRELCKYRKPPLDFDEVAFENAVELVCEHLAPYLQGEEKHVEDLNLNMSGSSGRPFKFSGYTDKRSYLPDYIGYQGGISYWDGFGKLEILPRQKALEKCRLICGVSAQLGIDGSRVFESQNENLVSGALRSHSALGFCKYYRGWHKLGVQLFPVVDEADGPQFDSSLRSFVLKAVYDIRARYLVLSPPAWKAFEHYLESLINSHVILQNGDCYLVIGGNKSGSVNTAHDNTIANLIYLAYAWLKSGRDWHSFHDFVIFVMGDDLISRPLDRSFWDFYGNFVNLQGRLKSSIPLEECSFLSQSFILRKSHWVAKPKEHKFLFSACFSDLKSYPELTYERIKGLLIDGYWSDDKSDLRVVMDALVEEFSFPPISDAMIENYWFGMEVGGPK